MLLINAMFRLKVNKAYKIQRRNFDAIKRRIYLEYFRLEPSG